MKSIYIDELKMSLFSFADGTNICADEKAVNGNHINYGGASAIAQVLIDFNCTVKLPVWKDENKCFRIPFIQVDDWKVEFNSGK